MLFANGLINRVIKVFISSPTKGPPDDTGFMWCSKEGGPGLYWSKEEADALISLSDYVLEMGWESSGYSDASKYTK